MNKLIKANMYLMVKNWLYIIGCFLAFVLTYFFTKTKPLEFMLEWEPGQITIFMSAATILYYSIFVGLFVGVEYSDHVIRNKMIAGHSQIEVYVSDYISMVLSNLFMHFCWLMGGICAGASLEGALGIYVLVCVLYNAAYIAIINALCFRVTSMMSVIYSVFFFYTSIGAAIWGNYFINFFEDQFPILKYLYRINGLGQYMTYAGLSVAPSVGKDLFLSVTVITIAVGVGMIGLRRRNVK